MAERLSNLLQILSLSIISARLLTIGVKAPVVAFPAPPAMFWLLLFSVAVAEAQDQAKALRPCFERYPNHRLVNVQPFHSEWRMRSEEHCLRFCALSSSRCRSIVYDTVQHICHYFLDDGMDVAVPAARMLYLRVATKECLDSKIDIASQLEEVTPEPPRREPQLETQPPFPMETEPIFETVRQMPPLLQNDIDQPEETGFAGSFDEDIAATNQLRRDLQQEPEQRWQSSMEKLVKNDEGFVFKKQKMEDMSAEEMIKSKKHIKAKIQKKLKMLQEKFPDKYVEYVKDSAEVNARPTTSTTSTTTTTTTQKPKKAPRKIGYSRQAMVPKKISFKSSEIRRKPVRPALKAVSLSGSSVVEKTRHFLESINGDARITTKSTRKGGANQLRSLEEARENGCNEDFAAVWVTFENSLDSSQKSIDTEYVENKEECQEKCNRENCKSFSFFDKESQCQLNINSDGVHLKKSHEEDFSASTSTRFCYAKSLPVFHGCNNFVGFRDLSVQIKPKEQFDGLPKGHAGLQYCIELCVLASEYVCRSASFLVSEGTCLLNSEDSLTKPNLFKPTLSDDHLYFENACSSPPPLKDNDKENLSIERVSYPKASPLKKLQQKTHKPTILKIQNNEEDKTEKGFFRRLLSYFF